MPAPYPTGTSLYATEELSQFVAGVLGAIGLPIPDTSPTREVTPKR